MVDFCLSEEQREYQKLAHEFAQRELFPLAHKFDMSGEFAADVLNKAWQTGLVNVQLPEELGGLGLSLFDACLIAEELAAGCSGIAGAIEGSALAMLPLLQFGSDAQKKEFLEPMAESFVLAGMPCGQYFNPERGSIFAKPAGAGFELSGKAVFINGHCAEWFLIVARMQPQAVNGKSADKLSLFVVPRHWQGMSVKGKLKTLGRKATDLAEVELKEVVVPSSSLIADEGKGDDLVAKILPGALTMLAAGCVGISQCGLDNSVRYSQERHTFKVPIAKHQAIAFMIADMAKDTRAARYLTLQAATLIDDGSCALELAMQAKAFAQDAAMRIATDAVQVFGGYGYSKEYPVEKLMRDAKTYQLLDGTSHELKGQLGRQLLLSV